MKNIVKTSISIIASIAIVFSVGVSATSAAEIIGSIGSTSVVPNTPTSIEVSNTGDSEITITWNEISNVSSYTLYRFIEEDGNMNEDEVISEISNTSYTDSGLENGTYGYKVEAVNDGLSSDKSGLTKLITIEVEEETTNPSSGSNSSSSGGGGPVSNPPNILNIDFDVSTSSAVISWETDEDSYTWLEYGTSTDLGEEILIEEYSQSHSVSLNDLEPDTEYYYQVKAIDNDGDESNYTLRSLITLALEEDIELEGLVVADDEELDQRVLGEKVVNERNQQILDIEDDAASVYEGIRDKVLNNSGNSENSNQENSDNKSYVNDLISGQDISEDSVMSINYFITYGTKTTLRLGAGERAGVIDSYKSAFNKLPQTEEEWQDVIKIANGRWPSERSEEAENRASSIFREIYGRDADMENTNDNAAITIISYGLRPTDRNMESEKAAINTFEYFYGTGPINAIHWDVVRAIAYSGATR